MKKDAKKWLAIFKLNNSIKCFCGNSLEVVGGDVCKFNGRYLVLDVKEVGRDCKALFDTRIGKVAFAGTFEAEAFDTLENEKIISHRIGAHESRLRRHENARNRNK